MHSESLKDLPGARTVRSIVRSPGNSGVVCSPLCSWVLGANMRRILFVALAFVVLLHLLYTAATRRTRRAEHPGAFRASPCHYARGFDPHHLSHKSSPGLTLSSLLRQFR